MTAPLASKDAAIQLVMRYTAAPATMPMSIFLAITPLPPALLPVPITALIPPPAWLSPLALLPPPDSTALPLRPSNTSHNPKPTTAPPNTPGTVTTAGTAAITAPTAGTSIIITTSPKSRTRLN